MGSREQFASRIGFILMTAGCAIGLGNIWRFPYVAGANGGGLFLLLYVICLLILGIPVLMMELAVGRAGQSTYPGAFAKLRQGRFQWEKPAYILFAGNMILLMFYAPVSGWLMSYTCGFISGSGKVWQAECFEELLADPAEQIFYTLLMICLTAVICVGGIRKSIEKSIKFMMGGLLILLLLLMAHSLSLEGAAKGVEFFIFPELSDFTAKKFFDASRAAMSQAFFTLSLGIGSIAVCGSYVDKRRSLFQEGCWITLLDTFVALSAGLIIFPCCMTYGVSPDAGPSLIFKTLPQVFRNMPFGTAWGTMFFIFLAVAAFSTLVAVFENIAAFGMDEFKWSRKKSCFIGAGVLAVLSLPCIFGFNLWKELHPLGGDTNILDLEDFIVSTNLLPLGSLYLTFFCMNKFGWGSENFFEELNTGDGWKFPRFFKYHMRFIIPVIIILLWLSGIWEMF